MPRYPVIYTRLSGGWTAELPTMAGLCLSAKTLAEVQDAVRATLTERLAVRPDELALEELVDAGETQYARLP
ncbi:MAG: hypothetical protein QOE76_2630 [Frankiales bacterium]|jgi:predicted RNase H-like HicB family nuclease|nr:hypothetical protein [Frankiales bacterium]